jgi:hypothetical protein
MVPAGRMLTCDADLRLVRTALRRRRVVALLEESTLPLRSSRAEIRRDMRGKMCQVSFQK